MHPSVSPKVHGGKKAWTASYLRSTWWILIVTRSNHYLGLRVYFANMNGIQVKESMNPIMDHIHSVIEKNLWKEK